MPTPVIGSDAFQEVDTVGITRPCVKHNFLVKDVRDLAMTIRKAFYIATTGRPGPVVVDIPKDVTDPNIKIPYHYPREIQMRSYNPTEKGHPGQIKQGRGPDAPGQAAGALHRRRRGPGRGLRRR